MITELQRSWVIQFELPIFFILTIFFTGQANAQPIDKKILSPFLPKGLLEQIFSAEYQTLQENVNRPGGDYKSFSIKPPGKDSLDRDTAGVCLYACEKDPKCQTWTYVKRGVQGPESKCWLKNIVPAVQRNKCCTSGVVMREFEQKTDRPGGDYISLDLENPDPRMCQKTCENDPKCRSWTYVKPGTGPLGRLKAICRLKSVARAAQTNDCCTSGIVFGPDPVIRKMPF